MLWMVQYPILFKIDFKMKEIEVVVNFKQTNSKSACVQFVTCNCFKNFSEKLVRETTKRYKVENQKKPLHTIVDQLYFNAVVSFQTKDGSVGFLFLLRNYEDVWFETCLPCLC